MRDVSIVIQDKLEYCNDPPFNPPDAYPELYCIYPELKINPSNNVYRYVRECLYNLGLDTENFDSSDWNPFGDLISPGDTVLIKPNLVLHFYNNSNNISAIVTHGSIIRPMIDYAILALKGRGQIIVGDAPHGNADFEQITEQNGLKKLIRQYDVVLRQSEIDISLIDFRKYVYMPGESGFVDGICKEVNNDPNGYFLIDLKEQSFLDKLEYLERLYGSDYNRFFIISNHRRGSHKYLIAGSAIKADVIINIPKLKTHKKVGLTVCLKNLVGINGDKNYLAHYRIGSPIHGGDEYHDTKNPLIILLRCWNRFSRDFLLAPNKLFLRKIFKYANFLFKPIRKICMAFFEQDMIEGGNWFGNDTAWRMCADLNNIILHTDKEGNLTNKIQRKYFCFVDGVLAGDGNGPMEPNPKPIGLIACGTNPFIMDYVCSEIMGFDAAKIKLISQTIKHPVSHILSDGFNVVCMRNEMEIDYCELNFEFEAPRYWKGKIEKKK